MAFYKEKYDNLKDRHDELVKYYNQLVADYSELKHQKKRESLAGQHPKNEPLAIQGNCR
jgi:hypothetical protein